MRNTLLVARLVFGASAMLSGVVGLLWHDSEIWQIVHPLSAPLAVVIAWCLGLAQIIAGIGMFSPAGARVASIVLGLVYAVFSLSTVPAMIAKPSDAVQYVVFFEELSMVCGAVAVYAATANAERSAAIGRIVRLGLGVCVVSFAWAQVVYFQYTASLVPTWIPPSQVFWTVLTTIAFALAALAILIKVQARLAIRLMALMMALFGLLVWLPRIVAQPATLSNWNEIASNYLMTGAALLVAELRVF